MNESMMVHSKKKCTFEMLPEDGGVGRMLAQALVYAAKERFTGIRTIVLNADNDSGASLFWERLYFKPRKHAFTRKDLMNTTPMVLNLHA